MPIYIMCVRASGCAGVYIRLCMMEYARIIIDRIQYVISFVTKSTDNASIFIRHIAHK
jgi:hypothetical protein